MPTTIQVSDGVKQKLEKMKLYARESYNEIIERMLEDELELNAQTKKEIEEAKKNVHAGKTVRHEDVLKVYGL